ncbi:dolichyl-phosphate-mannose-protein mannosyltransferase [Streptomyces puniciscabiei]|uniref:Dolichyl-phosphate-mannose-protein mannosyltransferase n=1 Tax=Streptomyces puniciscabiei TaxID=164348 RepID=A0A542SXW9_9ACTN|nr:glycosyltransferase family 39 protein [Streptomyces puniciscabiei]TQK79454.1 dolichyl-phosphate-mannose-protein mannosyltransferase [Streptomyces puniciscabiei]
MATNVLDATAPPGATRRTPWRSPADEPAYARPALLLLTVLAAVLYSWGIDHSQYHTFYASAARSMTESWKAFFYGSFDPGNSITLDKLPGFLWPQALSARLFGFHPWALVLPQVLEGVASLLVLHRIVRRWAGVHAALIACTAFLVTPVAVGLFRTAVEDPAFTLCLLLAAEATLRAARGGRLRPLLAAGVWVGLGFQAKMLEAWAVLPALALVYVLSAPSTLRRRLLHLGVSALAMTAVSASWMLAVTLTPANDRPYVDGTTNNSAFSMVVGYNFLNRFSSLGISAASTGSVSATQGGGGGHGGAGAFGAAGARGAAGASGTQGGGLVRGGARGAASARPTAAGGFGDGQNGWSKMFGTPLASQTGWFYPIAAVAAVCGLLWCRGRPRTDRLRAGYVLWTTWLALYFLVFSAGSVAGHTYYMGVIAVPLAALTGAGGVLMWRAHRAGGRRAWALPGAVAATAAWSVYLASRFPTFLPWLAPAVALLAITALVLLFLTRPGRPRAAGRLLLAAPAASLAALLLAPSAWAVQVFNPVYRTSAMGAVGPSAMNRGPGAVRSGPGRFGQAVWTGGRTPGQSARGGPRGFGRGGPVGRGGFGGADGSGSLTADQRRLLDYTRAHQGSAGYVFAAGSWTTASPYILAAGAHVLPLGGFSGRVPFPTEAQFRRLVDAGQVRYVLLGGGRGTGPGSARTGNTAAAQITLWVRSACTEVPASAYGGTSALGDAWTATAQTLYRCGPGR